MTVNVAPRIVPTEIIRAHAAEVDRAARFPEESIAALREAGLLALGVPQAYGGPGGTPTEIVAAVEQVAAGCASTAMVYTMHLVAAQTLLAGTADPEDGIKAATLREIATGEHLSTLAYSERGSRSHFWAQVSRAIADGPARVRIDADKSWVTSAGHADSCVVATGAVGMTGPLETELYLVDARADGIEVLGRFDGLGMRGNASSPVAYRDVRVDVERRLGDAGSGFGLMMSATLPWFVLCGAAASVGIDPEARNLGDGEPQRDRHPAARGKGRRLAVRSSLGDSRRSGCGPQPAFKGDAGVGRRVGTPVVRRPCRRNLRAVTLASNTAWEGVGGTYPREIYRAIYGA